MQEQISKGVDNAGEWADKINDRIDSVLVASGPSGGDDTVQLQADIDAAMAAGQALHIPAGNYQISSALTLTRTSGGQKITGDGENRTIITQTVTATSGFVVDSTGDYDGFVMRDISFVGFDKTGIGVDFGNPTNNMARCTLSNVEVRNWDIGMKTGTSGGFGIDQSTLIDCVFSLNNTGLEINGNANSITVQGGVINNNTTVGAILWGRGISLNGVDIGSSVPATNLIQCNTQNGAITNCYVELSAALSGGSLFQIGNGYYCRVEGCFFASGSTSTEYPIELVSQARVHSSANRMQSFAAGTPLILCGSSIQGVTGTLYQVDNSSTTQNLSNYEQFGNYFRIGPFHSMVNSNTYQTNDATRLGSVWLTTSGTSTDDDLVSVFKKGGGGGGATYHQTSMLNAKIIDELKAWVVSDEITAGSSTDDVRDAIIALQTAIGNMGD